MSELLHVPAPELRLDLACGQHPKEGFTGVDLWADGCERVDLLAFPWPWADGSVTEVHCSHFIEHIPMRETAEGQDLFFAFFDELHRVLVPGGKATVIWPALKTVRAFMDPTHRRFIPAESLLYLDADWRKANALDHYRVKCDFAGSAVPTVPVETTLRHPEAQAWMFSIGWDRMFDFHATLTKKG